MELRRPQVESPPVRLNLDMARFNPKANDLESGLDLALTAAWSIIDSKAMPVLLEGILLLGNSVNAASKNLGGAVGVTLESLTKLAHTRCLPAKQAAGNKRKSSRVESALEVLTLHLDQANQGFIGNLVSDLDACQSAKDFDHKLMASLVQELAEQVGLVQKHLRLHPESHAPCIQAQRLQSFLTEANGRIQHLQTCLEEIDEATVSLRQWFAEPPSSSLHDMLRVLAALRKLIPSPKPSDIPPPQDYRLSTTRKRRLEEKKAHPARETSDAAVTLQIPEGVAKTAEDLPEEVPEVKEFEADLTDRAKEETPEQTAQVVDQSASQNVLPVGSICEAPPPSGVLPQILSWSKGTIWISWLFDWTDVHRGFAEASAEKICAFEVLQFTSDCASLSQAELNSRPAASRWRCPTAPLKMDVPLGSHYVFGVRAILLKSGQLEDAEMLWASSVSSPVTLDLRYSTSSSSPSLPIAVGSAGSQENPLESSPKETSQEKSPNSSPRRGRGASGPVASGIGEFLSGGSPGRRLSLRPASLETSEKSPKSPKSFEVGSPQEARPSERDQAPSEQAKSQPRESTGSGTATAQDPPVTILPESRETTLAEGSPATLPKSNDEHWTETDTTASGQSPSSSPQDLNDLNDESLRLLMKACSVLETSRTSSLSCRTSEPTSQPCSRPPAASGASHAQPVAEPKEASQGIRTLSVPRARSIYEDDDFVNGMADKLSKSNVYLETHYEPGDGDLLQPEVHAEAHAEASSLPEILDGEEVYARMQREFEQKCKACNGTGYVGWWGPQGWGLVQRKCRDCSKSAVVYLQTHYKLPPVRWRPLEKVVIWRGSHRPCARSLLHIFRRSRRTKQLQQLPQSQQMMVQNAAEDVGGSKFLTCYPKRSCSIFRDLGDRAAEVDSLLQLSVAQLEADAQQEALGAVKRAQELCKAIGDSRRHAMAFAAENLNKEFKSGLWVPGKGMAAKMASGIGGKEVRKQKFFPQVQPEFVAASQKQEEQEQQMRDRRFGHTLSLKPFPWTAKQANVQEPAEKTEVKMEAHEKSDKQEKEQQIARENRTFSWSDALSTPTGAMGAMDGYWQCGQCGMIFTDPEDGARTDATGDFAWFCRTCWRHWVDDHLRRARAAKEAGVGAGAGGKGSPVKSVMVL
eukprot:s1077_g14.t1